MNIVTDAVQPAPAETRQPRRADPQKASAATQSPQSARPEEAEPERRVQSEVDRSREIESYIEKDGREVVFGGRSIQFSFNREIDRVVVRVLSEESGEVVRQIPPDEYLRFLSQLKELTGVLLNDQA